MMKHIINIMHGGTPGVPLGAGWNTHVLSAGSYKTHRDWTFWIFMYIFNLVTHSIVLYELLNCWLLNCWTVDCWSTTDCMNQEGWPHAIQTHEIRIRGPNFILWGIPSHNKLILTHVPESCFDWNLPARSLFWPRDSATIGGGAPVTNLAWYFS